MIQLIQNTDGLKSLHKAQLPLFEKIYMPPEYGDKLVSRVYHDGSLYYLTQPRTEVGYVVKDQKWAFIGLLSEKGIKEIKLKIDTICKKSRQVQLQNLINYELVWRLNCGQGICEFGIVDDSDNQNQIFDEITEIVNME